MTDIDAIATTIVDRQGRRHVATLKVATQPPWRIQLESDLGMWSAEESDLFECLARVRQELERHEIKVCCVGARGDVFPSGMSRQMSGGRRAYLRGQEPGEGRLVDIFDETDPSAVVTVAEQLAAAEIAMAERVPVPPSDLVRQAQDFPGGWVYEIDGSFGPNDDVPPEAVKGAWEVRPDGTLSGKFIPNPRYGH